MATLSGIAVEISAQTSAFQSKMSRAQDAASDLSLSLRALSSSSNSADRDVSGVGNEAVSTAAALQFLQGRTDAAGDEFDALQRKGRGVRRALLGVSAASVGTAGALSTLTPSAQGLQFSLAGIQTSGVGAIATLGGLGVAATALLSTLFPLAAVLGTLTAGVGALAGAFGAVVGTGILAFGEKRGEQNRKRLEETRARIERLEALQETEEGLTQTQQEELETLQERADTLEEQTGIMGGLKDAVGELTDELAPLITAFGEKFIPLIEAGLDALPELVEDTLAALGGLEAFRETLGEFGSAAMDIIPMMASEMVRFARIALPVFVDFVEFLSNNASRALDGMLRVTQRLAPTLLRLGRAFLSALPELTKLGVVTLETVVPALSRLLGIVEDVINIGEGSDSLVGFLKTLITKAQTWITSTGIPLVTDIGGSLLGSLVDSLGPGGGGGEGEGSVDLIGALTSRIGDMLTGVNNWLSSGGKTQIEDTATEIVGQLADGLANLGEDDISGGVDALTGIIGDIADAFITVFNSDEFEKLNEQLGSLAGNLIRELGENMVEYAKSDAFVDDLSGLSDAVADAMAAQLRGLDEALGSVTLEIGGEKVDIPLGFSGAEIGGEGTREFTESLSAVRENVRDPTSQKGTAISPLEREFVENQTPFTVEVTVDGDTEIVRETAVEVVDEEDRAFRRNTGTTGTPR